MTSQRDLHPRAQFRSISRASVNPSVPLRERGDHACTTFGDLESCCEIAHFDLAAARIVAEIST
jgi:hypothetical protein